MIEHSGQSRTTSINVEEVREKSHIFGQTGKDLTTYQQRINKACEELCVANPSLLVKRGELLEKARAKLHEEGYVYKKGYSRSQVHGAHDSSKPKRPKISQDERKSRIDTITDKVSDLDRLIRIKERRIEEATITRSFASADQLANEIRTYKAERVQLMSELSLLQKKEKRHKSYVLKKQSHKEKVHISDDPDIVVVESGTQSETLSESYMGVESMSESNSDDSDTNCESENFQ